MAARRLAGVRTEPGTGWDGEETAGRFLRPMRLSDGSAVWTSGMAGRGALLSRWWDAVWTSGMAGRGALLSRWWDGVFSTDGKGGILARVLPPERPSLDMRCSRRTVLTVCALGRDDELLAGKA